MEDSGRRNNVRIVGVVENSEAVNMKSLVCTLLKESLGMNVDRDFEIESQSKTLMWTQTEHRHGIQPAHPA